MARVVAALYVDPKGSYAGLPDVDLWDEARDARLYAGPRFGLKRGDDGGCFAAAVDSVRRVGGVLEHPAYSAAFGKYDLPRPTWHGGWTRNLIDDGWSCYVEQGRYGLPVKKATWLYAYGVELPELRWGYTPDDQGPTPNGAHGGMDAWRDAWSAGVTGHAFYKGHRNDGMRSTTPPAFRDVLLAMARTAA